MDQIEAGVIFSQFIYDSVKRVHPEIFSSTKLKFVKVLFSSKRLYQNRKNNQKSIINLVSNSQINESFTFEHWCH